MLRGAEPGKRLFPPNLTRGIAGLPGIAWILGQTPTRSGDRCHLDGPRADPSGDQKLWRCRDIEDRHRWSIRHARESVAEFSAHGSFSAYGGRQAWGGMVLLEKARLAACGRGPRAYRQCAGRRFRLG